MDDFKNHGLLCALVKGTEANARYEQRKRETAFDQAVQEQLWTNPAHCVLPDNFNEH
jgi:hypothetical protein